MGKTSVAQILVTRDIIERKIRGIPEIFTVCRN